MDERSNTPESQQDNTPPFRGLYRYVKISVKTLDKIIIGLIALILIVVFIEMRNPGFNISFDSRGGTDVPSQTQMYGEYLEVPEPPTREGYQFTGWYTDETCEVLWVLDTRTIETDMTLYAGWEKIE